MIYKSFPKGSIWRKWDLHVHTPYSVLSNEFGDNWDNYVQKLFKKAIENNIEAIGITDYFLVEGYKKLKNDYLKNRRKLSELFTDDEIDYINKILIFPNIEFRIDKLLMSREQDLSWNRKVNLHLLLSDQIKIEDIEENLLNQIKFEINGTNDGSAQKIGLTKRNLEDLGKELRDQHEPFKTYSNIFVGMMNATINMDNLIEELKSKTNIFQGKYLIGLPADEDLSEVNWNSGGHILRKVLIQKSQLIFSSNQNTIKFGLGGFHSTKEDFENEFKSLKPCVWGSDAHNYEKIFLPDENRFTWIKADNSFDGLKQIVYEPNNRVKIQAEKPGGKTPYNIIDKIRFIDNSGNNIFSPTWISLNEDLNAIIGGKSSGKSLLLYHVAKTIDPEQVNEKTIDSTSDYSKFITEKPFDIEVLWESGDKDLLSKITDKTNQITYVPQLYINHLAEKDGETHLFDLIESILGQNEKYSDYKIKFDRLKEIKQNNISHCIDSLLRLSKTAKEKNDQIRSLGTDKQIKSEIDRLKLTIENLKKTSGLSDLEIKESKALEDTKRKVESEIKFFNDRKTSYQKLKSFTEEDFNYTVEKLNTGKRIVSNETDHDYQTKLNSLIEGLKNNISNSFSKFFEKLDDEIINISKKQEENDQKHIQLNEKLKPFELKAKNKDLLIKTLEKLKLEEVKLIDLKKHISELKKIVDEGKSNNQLLFNSYSELFILYIDLNKELSKPEYNQIDSNLNLNTNLIFDVKRFSDSFNSLFDMRANFQAIFDGRFDDTNSFIYIKEQHVSNIKIIYERIRKESELTVRFRSGINPDEKYAKLFDDYFKLEYSIEHNGDDILNMSPGKRGLVLLQLILHLSNATHPILIDQPEDSLDNRTIYFELKQFVKDKKKDRQIIIVTHNANLAVSTDAENIIVANQDGQQLGKDNNRYLFEYVSGSLENNFINLDEKGILYQQGIREHVCDVLEGGEEAFKQREQKYGFSYLK